MTMEYFDINKTKYIDISTKQGRQNDWFHVLSAQ